MRDRTFTTDLRQPWLLTFADLTTLLLTFFVLLVGMSFVDAGRQGPIMESVRLMFGAGSQKVPLESSPPEEERLTATPSFLFAENEDMLLHYTDTEVVVSLLGDLLFREGSAQLGPEGRQALDRLAPVLQNLVYPAHIVGYSSISQAEGVLHAEDSERSVDSSWGLSLERALAVYRYFSQRGVDKSLLRVEGYGSHRGEDRTLAGRRVSRRIELRLDKLNPGVMGLARPQSSAGQDYMFQDFSFSLSLPGEGKDGQKLPGALP